VSQGRGLGVIINRTKTKILTLEARGKILTLPGSKRRGTSVGKKGAKKTKKDEERQQQRSAPVEARREPPPG
jgi:hypothetical protein